MKKYLLMGLCAGLLFTATGCKDEKKEESPKKDDTKAEEKVKNKKLSCSAGDLDKNKENAEYIFTYDTNGKKVENIKSILKWDESPTEIKDENLCDKYLMGNKEAIKKCDANLKDYIVTLNLEYEVDTYLDGREYNKNTPIDELKEIKEAEGYACKIEEE